MLHFANPLGLWALLAVPVILAIHCLQEKSRRLRVSTLFLLERVAPESVSGAKFERLRQSLPMWMQLLAACLLAWMLAEPRWMKKDSQQTLVIVLDSTASMSAFNTEARTAIEKTLAQWAVKKTGPPYAKFGRHVRYRLDLVEAWEEDQLQGRSA